MFENFIYLGYYENTHFIKHCNTINSLFTHSISGEIYEELIKNNLLTSPKDKITIYSFNSYKNEYKIISIQNAMIPGYILCVKKLSDFYYELLKNQSHDIINIRYEYENNSYKIQNIKLSYLPSIPELFIYKKIFINFIIIT